MNDDVLNTLEEQEAAPNAVSLTEEDETKLKAMMGAGVFYGYTKSRTQPKMRKFIVSTRAGVEIIDLVKTIESLTAAVGAIKAVVAGGGTVLFVGTTPAVKGLVETVAKRLNMPYVTERWLGGTLTNFKTISERIRYFKKLKSDKESGALDKYTKKERLLLDQELMKLEKFFGGIRDMDHLPAMVVIVDLKSAEIAAREARITKIPIVALLNTNADPDMADYPIPVNTRSTESVQLILSYLESELLKTEVNA